MAEKDEMKVVLSPKVQATIAADPEKAKAIKEFIAVLHQAVQGVETGQYKSFDDAMEALTGSRPEFIPDEEDDEDSDNGC